MKISTKFKPGDRVYYIFGGHKSFGVVVSHLKAQNFLRNITGCYSPETVAVVANWEAGGSIAQLGWEKEHNVFLDTPAKPEKPKLDLSKPVRFWNGREHFPARIVDTEFKHTAGYSVLALVEVNGAEVPYVFKFDGSNPVAAYWLVNIPTPPVSSTRFFLLTEDGNIWACSAKAKEGWVKKRIGQKVGNRLIVGFKKITIKEGDGADGLKDGCCGNCKCS